MKTKEIKFELQATACNVNVYKAEFAGCVIELAEDKQSLQLVDDNGDHETWEQEEGNWTFVEGSNEQAPTLHWAEDDYRFLEAAIAAL